MEKKYCKNPFIKGRIVNIRPVNNIIAKGERSAFTFDLILNAKKCDKKEKILKVYVPESLRKRCIAELQEFDLIKIKITTCGKEYKYYEYIMEDFHLERRDPLSDWLKQEILKQAQSYKNYIINQSKHICTFVSICYSKPQLLKTIYAKPINTIIEPCLRIGDTIYYINELTNRVNKLSKNSQVKIIKRLYLKNLPNIDARLLELYNKQKKKA